MSLDGHDFQAFGHVGFIDPVQMDGGIRLFEHPVGDRAQVSPRGVAQVRQRAVDMPRQLEQRRPVRPGLGVRRQQLLAKHDHVVPPGVQLQRL